MRALSALLVVTAVLGFVFTPATADARGRRKKSKSRVTVAPKPTTGTLTIDSSNIGANVEIDGKRMANIQRSQPKITLPPGQHTIRVSMRGFLEYVGTFIIKAGDNTFVEVSLIAVSGIVKITTTPPGATVKVNGKVLGLTPFDRDIPAGTAVIEISRAGYVTVTRKAKLIPGKRLTINNLALKALAGPVVKGKAFYKTWWFWTVVGVVVAGGATATALVLTSQAPKPPAAAFSVYIP